MSATNSHPAKAMQPQDKNWRVIVLFSALLLFTGCGGSGGDGASPDDAPVDTPVMNAEHLPLLPDGSHVGMIKGFNTALPPESESALEARWNEAVNAGMRIGRIQVDWAELEPAPGNFDSAALLEPLQELQAAGLRPFVLLSTIDSDGYTLPADLSDPNDPTRLADGESLASPTVFARFTALLDWMMPHLSNNSAWVLAVGNEPGALIDDNPEQGDALVEFLAQARDHVRGIDPQLAVTMTLNYDGTQSSNSRHVDFLANSDVASFNYYAADAQIMFENQSNVVHHEIDDMLAMAGEKLLILQELGAASGYEDRPSPMGASLEGQRDFYADVFAKMRQEPRFRAAVIFQLIDWDPQLVDALYTWPLIEAGTDAGYASRFAEALNTTGLIRFSDGSSKPSWEIVVDEISQNEAAID